MKLRKYFLLIILMIIMLPSCKKKGEQEVILLAPSNNEGVQLIEMQNLDNENSNSIENNKQDEITNNSEVIEKSKTQNLTDTVKKKSIKTLPADYNEFVQVTEYIPGLYVELKYATDDNITGQPIYSFNTPYLRAGTIRKLKTAQEKLNEKGYSLLIWDAYRPVSAQFLLWEVMPDSRYIANPNKGYSDHSRGNCVDVSIVKIDGTAIPTPTGFDDFTSNASRNYSNLKDTQAAENAKILEKVMEDSGFVGYSAEWWHYKDSTSYPVEKSFNPSQIVTIKFSAVGDCVIGNGYGFSYSGSVNEKIDKEKVDYSYFFSGVHDILNQDDFTIANAENVFTTLDSRVEKGTQKGGSFWFKGKPEYVKAYSAGSIEVVSIANNHSHDYSEDGLAESIKVLTDEGIGVCGYDNIYYAEKDGVRIAFIGINVFGPLEEGHTDEEIFYEIDKAMDISEDKSDIQVFSFHWGTEGTKYINDQQKNIAKYAVDHGADLILGHGPHVLQDIEEYNNVPIVYSLGNFVFGGIRKNFFRNTIIFTSEFKVDTSSNKIVSCEYDTIEAYLSGSSIVNDYRPILKE